MKDDYEIVDEIDSALAHDSLHLQVQAPDEEAKKRIKDEMEELRKRLWRIYNKANAFDTIHNREEKTGRDEKMACGGCPFAEFAPDGNDYCKLFGECVTDYRIGSVPKDVSWGDGDPSDYGCYLAEKDIERIQRLYDTMGTCQDEIESLIDKARKRKSKELSKSTAQKAVNPPVNS